MDSRRVSVGINHYLNTMVRVEGRAMCASETLYSMDAVAKAHGWVYAVTFTLPTTVCGVDRGTSRSPCETLSWLYTLLFQ